jgi:hypothetical protein
MAEPNGEGQGISRRTANKALLLFGAAVGLGEVRRAVAKDSLTSSAEERKSEAMIESKYGVVVFETKNARIYFLRENHDRPELNQEIIRTIKPNLVFMEGQIPAKDLISASDEGIMGMTNVRTGQRRIDDETRVALAENGTLVVTEGISIPEKYGTISSIVEVITPALGAMYLAGSKLIEKYGGDEGKEKEKPSLQKQWTNRVATLASLWGVSSLVGNISLGIGSVLPQMGEARPDKIFKSFNSVISQMHPENITVFFRNLMFIRKLQVLSEDEGLRQDQGIESGGKMKIVCNLGGAHEGVRDLGVFDDKSVLDLLSRYPKDLWRQMSEINGGLDELTTSVVIKNYPKAGGGYETRRASINDSELKKSLERKVAS